MAQTKINSIYTSQAGNVKAVYNMYYDSTSGNVIVKRQTITSSPLLGDVTSPEEELFSNQWTSNAIFVSPDDKKKIEAAIKTKLDELHKNPSNTMPGFYTQGTAIPDPDPDGLIPQIIASLTEYPKLENFSTKSIFNKNEIIKYPLDIIDKGQDILEIVQYTYKPPYFDVVQDSKTADIGKRGVQRGSAIKDKIASLYLPIPNNVSDSNAAAWSGEALDSISLSALGNMDKVLAIAAIKEAKGAADASGLTSMLSAAASRLGPVGQIVSGAIGTGADFVKDNPQLAYGILSGTAFNPTLRKALENVILKKAGFDIPIETVLSRGYGVVPNSNLELLFSGPTLRGFSFGYNMTPRSKDEAANCRKIIRFFKQGMAPKKDQSVVAGYGAPSFLLGTPNVFKLSYKTWDYSTNSLKSIAGLNKFKICALTNLQTSYAEGSWAAYEEGQPVRMTMQLAFKELEPVYESDYQEQPGERYSGLVGSSGGFDQDPVKPNEIGY